MLVDPGTFADDLAGCVTSTAVLVTHQHPDHLDPDRLPGVVAANPGAVVLCDPGSVEVLAGIGVEARAARRCADDGRPVTVTPLGRAARAHPRRDPAYDQRRGAPRRRRESRPFFHPGDALDAEPGQVDVLAFPLQAPWQRSRDMTAFLRRHGAPHAVPVHDGLLQPRGRDLYLGQAGRLGSPDTRIHDLAGAGPTEFPEAPSEAVPDQSRCRPRSSWVWVASTAAPMMPAAFSSAAGTIGVRRSSRGRNCVRLAGHPRRRRR